MRRAAAGSDLTAVTLLGEPRLQAHAVSHWTELQPDDRNPLGSCQAAAACRQRFGHPGCVRCRNAVPSCIQATSKIFVGYWENLPSSQKCLASVSVTKHHAEGGTGSACSMQTAMPLQTHDDNLQVSWPQSFKLLPCTAQQHIAGTTSGLKYWMPSALLLLRLPSTRPTTAPRAQCALLKGSPTEAGSCPSWSGGVQNSCQEMTAS